MMWLHGMVRQASKRLSESIETTGGKGYRDESDTDNGYAYNPGHHNPIIAPARTFAFHTTSYSV